MFSGPSKSFCRYLTAFSPSFLKAVQRVMGKGEDEVLRRTVVVGATDWERADCNAPLSLCNRVLGESALISCRYTGLGSCSLLCQAQAFYGKDWVRRERMILQFAQERGVLPLS